MISFFFKGGHDAFGCEFSHKSFREFLFAERLVEILKAYGRAVGEAQVQERADEEYWKDFEPQDPRYELSRELSSALGPQWLTAEVQGHLASLIRCEISRSHSETRLASSISKQSVGLTSKECSRSTWNAIRDGLADLWEWWAEGVHLRTQPSRKPKTREYKWAEPYAVDVAREARFLAMDSIRPPPIRTVTIDAHLGDGICTVTALVHCFLLSQGGPVPSLSARLEAPRRYQRSSVRGLRFAPSGLSVSYFRRYTHRINAAGYRPRGEFPAFAMLSGVDLSHADFRRVDMSGTDLGSANLAGANMHRATLRNADLSSANLRKVNLSNASLSGAKLVSADLVGANLTEANLIRAEADGADLRDANLRNANLNGAQLVSANLNGTNLSGATMKRAVLQFASLVGARAPMADLIGADFSKSDCSRAYLAKSDLTRADFVDANLETATLLGARLRRSNLTRANLAGATLRDADLFGAVCIETNLRGTSLRGANAIRADFTSANLSLSNLKGAELSRINLTRANLTGADLSGANLSGANLSDVDLYDTDLTDTIYAHLTCRVLVPEHPTGNPEDEPSADFPNTQR